MEMQNRGECDTLYLKSMDLASSGLIGQGKPSVMDGANVANGALVPRLGGNWKSWVANKSPGQIAPWTGYLHMWHFPLSAIRTWQRCSSRGITAWDAE